ncbi:hypothetical protein N0V82_008479 [Gnomoniopsis sp. IMI 355080]|nr:hypothetical protein N0V82_008479 [Gnomoniopsis sp. IMI 355080]
MPLWAPGPFYSYTTGYTPAEMRDALTDLEDFILENGPFDCVFGFSQGASLAAAYILDYQRKHHQDTSRPPFGFAVFFSPVVVFSPETADCRQLVQGILDDSSLAFRESFPNIKEFDLANMKNQKQRTFARYLAKSIQSLDASGVGRDVVDYGFFGRMDCLSDDVPRPLHPQLVKDRIGIPTVHITGKRDLDMFLDQSDKLQQLCESSLTRASKHPGGHGIPTKKAEVRVVVDLIEWAYMESLTTGKLML